MKVAVGGETLRQQFGADDLTVLENEAAAGLVREEKPGDAGDHERIAQSEEDHCEESEPNRCAPNGMRR
jgi:hypothetical protein